MYVYYLFLRANKFFRSSKMKVLKEWYATQNFRHYTVSHVCIDEWNRARQECVSENIFFFLRRFLKDYIINGIVHEKNGFIKITKNLVRYRSENNFVRSQ